MGTNDYANEKLPFDCTLIQQLYRISGYPVTVAQFQAFRTADGYQQQKYWTGAGWAWRQEEQIEAPREFDEIFQTPNHPQVGVSWYEAVAFCRWLTETFGYEVRLPTEAEWERAARHTDGRTYPWNGEFDINRCNIDETGIGATSAVGIYPAGDAECGAADLSGNVWEWCITKWRDTYEEYEGRVDDELDGDPRRVLRGGTFSVEHRDLVRCAARLRHARRYRFDDAGFRVVSSGF
ncbi:formylglycine-generating enzyme family protein [Chloroflexi bacterium TSY]|nr:formylglycine-generating enzyme family protein [Chloroflexi bacterium TSY]